MIQCDPLTCPLSICSNIDADCSSFSCDHGKDIDVAITDTRITKNENYAVLKIPKIQAFDIGTELYSFCAILRHVNFNLTMYGKENQIQENMNFISRPPARFSLQN